MDQYGSDYITIVDEDGIEYELEVLCTLEYNGETYLGLIDANCKEPQEMELTILKSKEEDGKPNLYVPDSDEELEAVYERMMEQLFEDEDPQ